MCSHKQTFSVTFAVCTLSLDYIFILLHNLIECFGFFFLLGNAKLISRKCKTFLSAISNFPPLKWSFAPCYTYVFISILCIVLCTYTDRAFWFTGHRSTTRNSCFSSVTGSFILFLCLTSCPVLNCCVVLHYLVKTENWILRICLDIYQLPFQVWWRRRRKEFSNPNPVPSLPIYFSTCLSHCLFVFL